MKNSEKKELERNQQYHLDKIKKDPERYTHKVMCGEFIVCAAPEVLCRRFMKGWRSYYDEKLVVSHV